MNTQERAVSTDINRLQKFAHQDLAEIMRSMLDVYPSGADDDAFAPLSEPSTVETPVRAEITHGLLVQPQAGSLNLLVTNGLAFFMNPDGGADESNYKYICDPGVTVLGTLTLTANASGSARIDVVECQINATEAIVTDSRDIYNTATGLFSASTVTKETKGQLTYRVRAGTPAAGFPGTVSGWLPLAVVLVPNGAVSCDTCTFWDVRPIVSDRENQPFAGYNEKSSPEVSGHIALTGTSGAPIALLSGHVRGFYNGRKIGGKIRRGSPGTDATTLDLRAVENLENALAYPSGAVATKNVFLYLMFPFGLPRWSRYTDGPAGRVPRAPRGIPIASLTAPTILGEPSAPIVFPSAYGFNGASSAVGKHVLTYHAGQHVGATIINASVPWPAEYAGKEQRIGRRGSYAIVPSLTGSVGSGITLPGGGSAKATFTVNTHFPKNAKFILMSWDIETNTTNATVDDMRPYVRAYRGLTGSVGGEEFTEFEVPMTAHANPTGAPGGIWSRTGIIKIPVPQLYPSDTGSFDMLLNNDGVAAFVDAKYNIYGWEM